MPLREAPPGRSHILPSRDQFNTFTQTAREWQEAQTDGKRPPIRQIRQTGIVTVRNDSSIGPDCERYGVLAIGGVLITPTDNEEEFLNRVLLSGVIPDIDLHVGKFVILLEPLGAGAMGRAVIDGVCVVLVEMIDEAHGFADVADGERTKLKSGACGAAQLLWVQAVGDRTDPDVAWCVVRLGGGGGAVVQRFRYKSMAGDYINCRTWDGTTEGSTDIAVAKPWWNRRTPFDGETRDGWTYTYSSDTEREAEDAAENIEQQVLIPSYVVNDEIWAIANPIGGTGVVDGGSDPVVWLECPTERGWTKDDG